MIGWRFCDAPTPFQALSPHGGDEDYVLLLEPNEEEPSWAHRIGVCDVSRHKLESGHIVLIGAHS